jgi:zinc transport system ATP-binding protein
MPLIQAKNLTLAYDGCPVASGIHFEVNEGDYLCIVGENGSGKSTLLKAILGLHPIAGGTLEISPEARRAGVGYLPQHTPAQRDFPASVREIVESGCLHRASHRPFWRREDKALVRDAMERMDIAHLANRCYRELSGGQQQRVLLARAYCATGKLIVLDEPIAGLDPLAMQEMYRLIAELNHSGVAVVMVSHDVAAAVGYATHILHVDKETSFFGTTEEYVKSPRGRKFGCMGRWNIPDTRRVLDLRHGEDGGDRT